MGFQRLSLIFKEKKKKDCRNPNVREGRPGWAARVAVSVEEQRMLCVENDRGGKQSVQSNGHSHNLNNVQIGSGQ